MNAQHRKQVGKALLMALGGFALLSVGDAVVKSISGQWPAPAVSALRYCFGAVGLAVAVALRHGRRGFIFPRPWLQIGRGVSVSLATMCFFLSVMAMPLADATAVQFTSPIITALLSGLVLGERVPKAAWAAIGVAFAGVLIVLRPNFLELGGAAFYPLGAAFGMAGLITLNRKSAGDAPMLVMQLTLAIVAAPLLILAAVTLSAVAGPGFQITVPSVDIVLRTAVIAFTASTGHLLIYWGTTQAGAAMVSPMTYAQLIVAVILGWIFFAEAPDALSIGGAVLIILGGLLLWRSQRPPVPAEGRS